MADMKKVYLDYAATTPVDERVFEAMHPYFCEQFGNANSVHSYGKDAFAAVDGARRSIAKALNVDRTDLFFTSGGTEANNWAVKCALNSNRKKVLVSAIEHPSVLEAAKQTGSCEIIPVNAHGIVTEEALEKLIDKDTALVSVMMVNNETGTVQNIKRLAEIAHAHGALLHTDAVQGLGSFKIDIKNLGADMLSISSHKIYGPKGIGALYVKEDVDIDRLIAGGHQERSLRGGTTNTTAIVGFARALELTEASRDAENVRLAALKNHFVQRVTSGIADATVNGADDSVPGIVNIRFDGINGDALLGLIDLAGVAASAGAACAAGSVETSHVLTAMGLTEQQAKNSLRFSLGRFTDKQDTDYAVDVVVRAASKIRKS